MVSRKILGKTKGRKTKYRIFASLVPRHDVVRRKIFLKSYDERTHTYAQTRTRVNARRNEELAVELHVSNEIAMAREGLHIHGPGLSSFTHDTASRIINVLSFV